MGIFGNATEALIEKATSETLVAGSEDLESSLQICDAIRSKQMSAKDAMTLFKKRLQHKSPSVHLLTFQLLDFVAKNGGSHFLVELASLSFTQFLAEYIKSPQCHFQVKEKALECIQIWGLGFVSKPELRSMSKLYETLRAEGITFPPKPDISEDFFESQTPPDWGDSDVCMRCRDPFSLTNRKHHCRKCGETFCSGCSSKSKPLPHLGITRPVRVCDGCYDRMTGSTTGASGGGGGSSSAASSLTNVAVSPLAPLHRGSRAVAHSTTYPAHAGSVPIRIVSPSYYMPAVSPVPLDHDMNLAIRLSIEESHRTAAHKTEDDDPILAAAIAASLKETSHGSLEEASGSLMRTIESTSAAIEPTPASFSSADRDMIRRFADHVRQAERAREPIRQELRDMYAQVYSLQAKLQRELDVTKEDFRKYAGLQQNFNEALRSYDAALETLESSSARAFETSPEPVAAVADGAPAVGAFPDTGSSSVHAYGQSSVPYPVYHAQPPPPPPPQQQQQPMYVSQTTQPTYDMSQPVYADRPAMSYAPVASYSVYSPSQNQTLTEPPVAPSHLPAPSATAGPSGSNYSYSAAPVEHASYAYHNLAEPSAAGHAQMTASAPNSYSPVPSHSAMASQTAAASSSATETTNTQEPETAVAAPEEEKPLIEF